MSHTAGCAELAQPVLRTERLILRPLVRGDESAVFRYASDPEVARTVTWEAHRTLDDTRAFFAWVEKTTSTARGRVAFVWAIESAREPGVFGSIEFRQGPFPHVGRVDFVISRAEWNRGYATEAVRAVIAWAHEAFAELVRFETFCLVDNLASARVLEKAGFTRECVRRKWLLHRGETPDTAHYVLLR